MLWHVPSELTIFSYSSFLLHFFTATLLHINMSQKEVTDRSAMTAAGTLTENVIEAEQGGKKLEQHLSTSTTHQDNHFFSRQQESNVATSTTNAHRIWRRKCLFQTSVPALRLSPPNKIHNVKDVGNLLWNHDFLRVLLLVVWLIFGGYVETFLAQLSEIRYGKLPAASKHPLRDLLHDAFPSVDDIQIVNNLLTITLLYTVIIGIGFYAASWTMRFAILRRWMFIMGCLYIFRGITLLVTTLPSPLVDQCHPSDVVLAGTIAERFEFLFGEIGGTALICTDNIFSGHTCVMMSCVMLWHIHFGEKATEAALNTDHDSAIFTTTKLNSLRKLMDVVVRWMLYMVAAAGILMILFTRFHYTVDVLLAIYITYSLWKLYLTCVQRAAMVQAFGARYSTRDMFIHYYHGKGSQMYDYLTYQPKTSKRTWVTTIITFVDGVDLRWKAIEADSNSERITATDLHQITVNP